MAMTERTRIVTNTGRKANTSKPKLSDKQIKFFGSPAQKAALKRRKHEHRTNNHAGSSKQKARRKVKHNIGEIIGLTLPVTSAMNPANKGNRTMATTKKNASKPAQKSNRKKAKKTNGTIIKVMKPNTGHSNRKPTKRNAGDSMTSVTGLATIGLGTVGGALGSKLLTQMALGAKNEGVLGYAGNAVVGAGLWWAVLKVSKNRTLSNAVLGGTAAQIVLRLINDYTPFGMYVANLGMGDYQAQAFVTPQRLVDPYNRAEIEIPGAWMPQAALPPPAPPMAVHAAVAGGAGMGSLYSGASNLY